MTDRPTDNPTALSTVWPAGRSTGRWLTFAQAGAELGLSAEATRSRARRAGWRTMPGNDGRTLVMIPEDLAIEPRPAGRPTGRPTDDPVATARSTETLTAAVASLRKALATLTEQLMRERDRADRAVDRGDRMEKERDALQGRIDDLSAKLTDAQEELASAQDQAATAEALQARIDGLVELWKAAEAATDEARQQARQAAETAEDVLRAEDARRRQGFLARLRSAWRGE